MFSTNSKFKSEQIFFLKLGILKLCMLTYLSLSLSTDSYKCDNNLLASFALLLICINTSFVLKVEFYYG